MNPASIASTFSIQKISKHHFLIRGDERVRSYMNFCEVKWSRTYQGWIVHEEDEIDFIQMHVEVMDNIRISSKEKNKKQKKSKKSKQNKDAELYERFKRGEEITDDEEDEYTPEESDESDQTDDYEEDSFCVKESSDEEEDKNVKKDIKKWIKSEKEKEKKKEESEEEDDSESESEEEEEENENDPNRKKEFQFYKKGILAYGRMTEKEQDKVESIWNKHLRGWIIRKSFQEKLLKMGWLDIDANSNNSEKPISKVKTIEEPPKKTFETHKSMLLVKGEANLDKMNPIFHKELGGNLISNEYRSNLIKLGFSDISILPQKEKSINKKVKDVIPPVCQIIDELDESKKEELVKITFSDGQKLLE